MPPATTCPECAAFLELVVGIRGEAFRAREAVGLRHSYTPEQRRPDEGRGPRRLSRVAKWRLNKSAPGWKTTVPAGFHRALVKACQAWGKHLEGFSNYQGRRLHLDAFPEWLLDAGVGVGFNRKVRLDAAVQMAAHILSADPRSVYRHGQLRA